MDSMKIKKDPIEAQRQEEREQNTWIKIQGATGGSNLAPTFFDAPCFFYLERVEQNGANTRLVFSDGRTMDINYRTMLEMVKQADHKVTKKAEYK